MGSSSSVDTKLQPTLDNRIRRQPLFLHQYMLLQRCLAKIALCGTKIMFSCYYSYIHRNPLKYTGYKLDNMKDNTNNHYSNKFLTTLTQPIDKKKLVLSHSNGIIPTNTFHIHESILKGTNCAVFIVISCYGINHIYFNILTA